MKWQDSIYSDGSKQFISNPTPKIGQTVLVSIRVWEQVALQCIFLRFKQDGLEYLEEMKPVRTENGFTYYQCGLTINSSCMNYHFYIVKDNEVFYYNQKGICSHVPDEVYDFKILGNYIQPEWVKGSVFYQIFPDRFYNKNKELNVEDGEYCFCGKPVKNVKNWNEEPKEFEEAFCLDFYGGDLPGIIEKISYLQELGINGLYVNPIFSAATVHKYDCIDYFHVDKHLGGEKAFEQLCNRLHEENMKIVLDISINHTGMAHKWFNREGTFFSTSEGAYNNLKKKEREFYYFEEDGTYGCYANIPTLPKLNFGSKKLRSILYGEQDSVLRKWLKAPYEIDGWRFDVAATTGQYKTDHYQHNIWPEICNAIRETKEQAYILAEDWNDASEFLQGNEWDAIMNFFGCGRPVRDYVGQLDFRHGRKEKLRGVKPNLSAKALAERIQSFFGKLPFVMQENQFNMLDCHDISRLHNHPEITFAQYEMAVYLLYILPGCVCIYYGDEIGLAGRVGSTEGCRYPMDWNVDYKKNPYYELYQTMNLEKNNSKALRCGGFKILVTEGKVFACARFYEEEVYLVVTSMEETESKEIKIIIPVFGRQFSMPKKDIRNQLLDYYEQEDGSVMLVVQPKRGYFIKLDLKKEDYETE